MAIGHSAQQELHWNYFLALEQDVFTLARYIEFADRNMKTYSLEIARILLAGGSEVDVVAKLLVKHFDPHAKTNNIDDYRPVITSSAPYISTTRVFMPRYGLDLLPWENWQGISNPDWWKSHNMVKHNRSDHFTEANLTNALNTLAGLFVLLIVYGKAKGLKRFSPAPHLMAPDGKIALLDVSNEGSLLTLL
jgi:hypothetical protein